ncbi:MAG: ERAP1-like C-terminal domain-containing protein [Acidimicrobiales bacterium]|nr:ERAP1-like C-terminal domain-containing protein [Acidimicrobiales bacterium]
MTAAHETDRAVPVVLRTGRGDVAEEIRVLLDTESATVPVDGDIDWIVGNHEGSGFYRVALGDDDLTVLAGRAAEVLSPLERYGLVEDEWALLLAGRGSIERLLPLLRSLSGDDDLSVWRRIISVIAWFDRLVDDETRPALQAWVRALLGPALQALGPAKVEGEADRVTALRAALALAVATHGQDVRQRELARQRFDAAGSSAGGADVDADLADAAVKIVATGADADTWEEIRRRANAAETAQDRLRHQGALADADDPELVRRFCDLVLTDEIRTQDGLFLLRRALANRAATTGVWAFVEGHWEEINRRFPSASVPRMLEGVRTVTDRTLATRIAAFLADHPVPQGEQVIRQHQERMWVSVALAERVSSDLRSALA